MDYELLLKKNLQKKNMMGWALILLAFMIIITAIVISSRLMKSFSGWSLTPMEIMIDAYFILSLILSIILFIKGWSLRREKKHFAHDRKYLVTIATLRHKNQGIVESSDLAVELKIDATKAQKILAAYVRYGLLKQDTSDTFYFIDSPLVDKEDDDSADEAAKEKEDETADDAKVEVCDIPGDEKKAASDAESGHPHGAGQSPEQAFASHASMLMKEGSYGNWKPIVPSKPKFGIVATAPDESAQIVSVYIKPSKRYPQSPPIVVVRPRMNGKFWNDNGALDWSNCNLIKWEDFSESKNPLAGMIDAFMDAFRIGV